LIYAYKETKKNGAFIIPGVGKLILKKDKEEKRKKSSNRSRN
jgi:hypothetical protein